MARLFADYALDISNLNLNRLISGYYDSQFVNNDYLTVGDYTYEDTLDVIYYSGGYASSLFGGSGFTFDQNGNLSGGTVTGYLQGFYSGTTPVAWWGIENFTYSADGMFSAALTASTTDDYSIISSILSGSDQFYLSNYADRVNGYAGNDYFYGRSGKDTLDGGAGSDTADYSEKTTAVKVILNKSTNATVYVNNSAEDTIKNIENINGGSGADTITGDAYANTLKGNSGNDVLNGGLGKDVLTGGSGKDYFDFTTALGSANVDTITDFTVGSDKIRLENSVMTKLQGTPGALNKASYWEGAGITKGHDADDRILYDTSSGKLYYDADGSGSTAAVQIALVGTSSHANLDYSDFLVI